MRLVQVFDDSAEVFTEPTSQPLDGELLPHLVVVPIRRVTRYARQQYGCIFPQSAADGIAGVVCGRALYEGTLDFKAAVAALA